MVVQVQAIHQSTSQDIAARFRQRAAEVRERAALKMADHIVDQSPIDTATYILAHVAGAGASPEIADRSSHGKARGVPDAQFRNLARGNLRRSVSSAAVSAASEIWFRNRAVHAPIVEYVHGYAVYAQTRAMADVFIREAAREAGMEVR